MISVGASLWHIFRCFLNMADDTLFNVNQQRFVDILMLQHA